MLGRESRRRSVAPGSLAWFHQSFHNSFFSFFHVALEVEKIKS